MRSHQDSTHSWQSKALPGSCKATVISFDDHIQVLYDGVEIQNIPDAEVSMFKPRGLTALYDAIGIGISMLEKQIQALVEPPSRIMIMILTDGLENSSSSFSKSTIANSIKRLQAKKWAFVFVGANQDAIMTGKTLNIAPTQSLSFTPDEDHQSAVWRALSDNCAKYRCSGKQQRFTRLQRSTTLGHESFM